MADVQEILEKIRAKCLARGASGIKGISRQFRIYDDDRSHTLSFYEFSKGLKDYGIDLSQDQLKTIFMYFDKDGSGTVSIDEFLVSVRPPMSTARVSLLDEVFKKVDQTGDGKITYQDLENKYDVTKNPKYLSGEKTKKELYNEFLRSFEPTYAAGRGDGIVTRQEFMDYYAGISAGIDKDVYFDIMIRNAWKI